MKCTATVRPILFPLALATAVAGVNAHADALGDAIAGGKANLELRYRFESVDQEATPALRKADASTLRTRLRYTTGEWQQMTAMVELDNVSRIGEDRYNDTRNGKTGYPLVVDPDGADLNQALVKYMGIANLPIVVGRQRVNLDNQRWIGSVAWRQNEQTLDGVVAEFKGIDKVTATYGFINRVNRINGPEPIATPAANTASEYDTEAHVLNVKYVLNEKLTGVGYAYLLDMDDWATASTQTYGLRLTGKLPVGEAKLGYAAEYAEQSDYARNTVNIDKLDYQLAEVTFGKAPANAMSWELLAGYEVLGSDAGAVAVQTPLATLHKFQGWADKFLATPNQGLVDVYAGGTMTLKGYACTLVAHQYEEDEGAAFDGDEYNVQVAKTFAKRYTVTAKYALYNDKDNAAVAGRTDTEKFWLMAEAKF